MTLDFRNANTLCTSIFVETLSRLGLTTAVLCPGSRCTPLTVAFAAHPKIEAIAILDERSAAFFALGRAKQTGQPVVLVCTSGTAGANFYPAIIEAHYSHVPLLVLTSDRPPELRHCHVGQTIDQLKLYSHYPQWQAELMPPEANPSALGYWRQMAMQAWQRCLYPAMGVVHLNLPFRDPLAPIVQSEVETLRSQLPIETFFTHCQPPHHSTPQPLQLPAPGTLKGLIIAGLAQPLDPVAYCQSVAHLAQTLQYPVLAAGLSPVRNWAALNPYLITSYEEILRDSASADLSVRNHANSLVPELIIQLGELPISKTLRQWLATLACPRWIIDPHPENFDPAHSASRLFLGTVEQGFRIEQNQPQDGDSAYLQQWQVLDQSCRDERDRALSSIPHLFEGKVAWLLSQTLPPDTPLMIANSMPVRDIAYFWQLSDRHIRPYFSRGANGIDGTLSTALGIAHRNQPTVLLTGDLAFLHDTNGLLQAHKLQGHLTIIVVNNNGGGIFEMLPIAQFDPPFEEFFATPQQVNLPRLCAAYGVDYEAIADWAQFTSLLNALPEQGVRVLEVRCDRKADQAQRRKLLGT